MRREVCDWLLHVVVVDNLGLCRKLTVLVKMLSCSLRELLMRWEMWILLPGRLVLQKYLMFSSSFPSTFLFWWLLGLFIYRGQKFRLLFVRLLLPSSSSSDGNNVLVFTS